MLRSIRNVKLLKCVSLICLSPLFVFYSSLNMLEKEVNPVLHRKNVNEATDKRKLFSSNRHMTFVQDGAPAHAAKAAQSWCKKKPAKFYRENMLTPKFPRYKPCGEFLEHNGLSCL